jgi:DNA mismatch repair protein MutL
LISYESRHDTYQETSHGRIVRGQLWDMYLILESHDQLYLVDQHAFAERIAYEKMKYLYHRDKNKKEVVVNPVVIELARHIDQTRLDELDELGFDVALISDKKIVIYAIPFVLRDQQIDLVRLIDQIIDAEQLSIDHIVDTIFAMKACKISIKAGQRLSLQEIDALVRE